MKMIRDLSEKEILLVAAASMDSKGRIMPLTFVEIYLERAMIRPHPRFLNHTSEEVSAILNPIVTKSKGGS